MNAEVISAFWDMQDPKKTTYNVGDTFTGTAERVAELEKKGFVKAAGKAEQEDETPAPKKSAPRRKKV